MVQNNSSALYKMKGGKTGVSDSRTTLDALHLSKVEQLKNEKNNLSNIETEISELESKIKTCDNAVESWQLERKLQTLKTKRTELQTGASLDNYFLRTGKILLDYYDIQDDIQKGRYHPKNTIKARPGSIIAILNKIREDEQQGDAPSVSSGPLSSGQSANVIATPPASTSASASASVSTSAKKINREELLFKYLEKEDPEKAKKDEFGMDEDWTFCESCGNEMIMCMNEATLTCSKCGHNEFILIDSDKPSYKDPPRELQYYAYKKINHFNEWLAQLQAKESTDIPAEIYDKIMIQLKKERIYDLKKLSRKKLRDILKNMDETKYYEHIPHILNRLSGENAPFMSREDEEILRHMFKEIQPSFKKHIPKGRRNFLSYGYILYKFCELKMMDEYLVCLPLLKNREKLYIQDTVWKKICQDKNWEFIKTV
jgi:ribosomal protein S27AE